MSASPTIRRRDPLLEHNVAFVIPCWKVSNIEEEFTIQKLTFASSLSNPSFTSSSLPHEHKKASHGPINA
jgi:hypothetical protein